LDDGDDEGLDVALGEAPGATPGIEPGMALGVVLDNKPDAVPTLGTAFDPVPPSVVQPESNAMVVANLYNTPHERLEHFNFYKAVLPYLVMFGTILAPQKVMQRYMSDVTPMHFVALFVLSIGLPSRSTCASNLLGLCSRIGLSLSKNFVGNFCRPNVNIISM
jgi:hypothetical protein